MEPRPTRRSVAKLLVAAGASLSVANTACKTTGQEKATQPAARASSEREKRELEKTIAQLQKALDRLKKMPIPTGSEPAFIFSPTLPQK